MPELIHTFVARGDLAHLALFLWAVAASGGLFFSPRGLPAPPPPLHDFIRELSRFNRRASGKPFEDHD